MQTVLCPNCSSMCLVTDAICFKCRTAIRSNYDTRISPKKKVGLVTSWSCALGMVACLPFIMPPASEYPIGIYALGAGIMVGGAGLLGRIIGWVIGTVAYDS
jgi:hypothetical protein